MQREDTEAVNRRLRLLVLQWVPVPVGVDLPAQDSDDPDTTAPGAMEQAKREIAVLQAAHYSSGSSEGGWSQLSEVGKVIVLDQWVSWHGVSVPDRAATVLATVNPEALPSAMRDALRDLAANAEGMGV